MIGFELLELKDERSIVGLNATPVSSSATLYSAQLATIPGIFTDVKLINTGDHERTVHLSSISDSGQAIGPDVILTLGAGRTIQKDARELFSANESGYVGSLRLTADGPGIVGDVIFGDPGLDFASGLLLQTTAFRDAVFAHVAQGDFGGDHLFTGLAFYNPGFDEVTVSIQVFGFQKQVGERELKLGAGCRIARLISELTSVTQQIGGYIIVKASGPVIAQELFGNGRFLSAVPPMQLKN